MSDGVQRFDHITPVLRDLHWLQIRKRITYKVAMLVYNSAIVSGGFLPIRFICFWSATSMLG
jgi:hypothetical protein